eukprot:Transcript_24137.p4 GENE.Transcript_24137~~Transcript_24137.p4  ORF type:complete len:284 (+),score=103.58 Transcript_24137:1029-1880(+)
MLHPLPLLCQDVLGAVPEKQFALEDIQYVLSDALALLACKEIKLGQPGGDAAAGGADEADEATAGVAVGPSAAQAAAASAHGKLLSQVARKATVEAIMPVVVELKRYLEAEHSPLLGDLFLFLRELLKDHKQYLQDILSRDRQLAAEIEYDMKQLDAQSRHRALQSMSPAALQSNRKPLRSPAAMGTPRSVGKAMAMRVPSSEQLSQLSVPRLRKQRVSASGLALSAMRAPSGATPKSGGPGTPAPSAVLHHSRGSGAAMGSSSNGTPAIAAPRADLMLASPR